LPEVNINDDSLKQIIKDILIIILKYDQKNNYIIKYIRQQFVVVYH